MDQVLKLAENYLVQRVMGNHTPLTHVNKAIIVMGTIGGILSTVALVFILFGVFQWLMQNVSPYEAYILFGGMLLTISFILFGAIAFFQHRKKKKTEAFKNHVKNEILFNLKLAEQEFKDSKILEDNPKICAALASIVGFVLTKKVL